MKQINLYTDNNDCYYQMLQTPTTIIHQFYTDAPRISFYFNATEFTKNVAFLHQRIVQFCSKHKMKTDTVLFWCTQTALASIFVKKHAQISEECSYHHLFDDGRQRITFDDHKGEIHIVKPFRVDEEDNHTFHFHTLKRFSLHVVVGGNKDEDPLVEWNEPGWSAPTTEFVEKVGALGMVCALAMTYFVVHRQC